MRIEVLGSSRIVADRAIQNFPTGMPGLLLQSLVLRPNQVVDTDTLVSTLWPADHHRREQRLRVVASRLRSSLHGNLAVEAASGGYRLRAKASSLDELEFRGLASRAFDGDVAAAHAALRLWRGEPYGAFKETPMLLARRIELVTFRDRLRTLGHDEDRPENGSPIRSHFRPPPAAGSPRLHALLKHLPPVGDVRLVTVTAPAGLGKTALLGQWAERDVGRIAWLRLRDQENDASMFWYSLGAAFASVAPGVLAAHSTGPECEPEHLLAHLLNGLVRCDTALGVVMDGFHVITNPHIHQQLDTFLHRCPPGHTIAIASQEPIPLRASRYRASHDMVAVDEDDLRRSAGTAANNPSGADTQIEYDGLGDAVALACASGDANSARRLLTSADPQIALSRPGSRDVCLPAAAALLRPDQRHRWLDAAFRIGNRDAAIAAAEAVQLYRMGRCHESLATAESALSTCETPASRHSHAVLVATVVACQTMLGLPVAPYRDQHSGWSAAMPAAWPWLTRWELGQRALLAYVRGEYPLAQVLVDEAAGSVRGLHRSWRELTDGVATVVSTLLDSAQARTRAEQRRLARVLDAAIHRADRTGHAPLGMVARYAAWLVHLRADGHEVAATRLAEADARLERHSGLQLPLDVRSRLADWRAMPMAPSELDGLSARERQVLPYLATDLTMAKIAQQMYLSPHTVRSHVRSIYRKLGVQRRVQAIRYATPTDELYPPRRTARR